MTLNFYKIIWIFFFLTSYVKTYSQLPVQYPNFPKILDSLNPISFETSTPLIADLNKDGQKEIITITGIPPINLYVIKSDGTNQLGYPKYLNNNCDAVACGDIDGNGLLDIVIRTDNTVEVFDLNGNNLAGFPFNLIGSTISLTNFLSLFDLDNDGKLEIITNTYNYQTNSGTLVVINFNGQIRPGWPRSTIGDATPGPALGDIDNDGFGEIIFTTYKRLVSPPYVDSGAINIYRHDGTQFFGQWPIYFDSGYAALPGSASLFINHNNSDSSFIIIPTERAITLPYYVNRIIKYSIQGIMLNRAFKQTIGDGFGTMLIADLNRDGNLKFITGTQYEHDLTVYTSNLVQLSGWSKLGSSAYSNTALIGKFSSNNSLNVISCIWRAGLPTGYGYMFGYDITGNLLNWFPFRPAALVERLSASDINNDGSVEIIATAMQSDKSFVHVWTIPGIAYTNYDFPWAQYGHDRYRTNQYGFIPPDDPIGIAPISNNIPFNYKLYQNYPNPFNPSTKIKFDVPNINMRNQTSNVKLIVYDILGREIKMMINEKLKPGTYEILWNATAYSSGIYFYSLITESFIITKKMVLIK